MNLWWDYISNGSNWSASDGIATRLGQHIGLSVGALLIAFIVGMPLGIAVGHSGKGDDLPILFGTLGRLLPPLGVLVYFAMKTETGTGPSFFVVVLLGMAPIMAAGYAGVRLLDRPVIESARASGMLPMQILREIEIPMAMPKLIEGVRQAAVAIVSMVAVAAYTGASGLGRLIIDGQKPAVHDYGMVATGGVLLAVLAVALDRLIAVFGSTLIPPGLYATQSAALAEIQPRVAEPYVPSVPATHSY
ncbi:MAG TPA: ABC transporter permease subunit [Sporichthyaceae bacterium]|jgi:osmoprotectant transport system permease protein